MIAVLMACLAMLGGIKSIVIGSPRRLTLKRGDCGIISLIKRTLLCLQSIVTDSVSGEIVGKELTLWFGSDVDNLKVTVVDVPKIIEGLAKVSKIDPTDPDLKTLVDELKADNICYISRYFMKSGHSAPAHTNRNGLTERRGIFPFASILMQVSCSYAWQDPKEKWSCIIMKMAYAEGAPSLTELQQWIKAVIGSAPPDSELNQAISALQANKIMSASAKVVFDIPARSQRALVTSRTGSLIIPRQTL